MSDVVRSITIRIRNALPDRTLGFTSARATEGLQPAADVASVGPGGSITVSARAKSGGCAGSFVLESPGVRFVVSYARVGQTGNTTITAEASTGYVWATDAMAYSGRHITAELDLYQGVTTRDDACVVPLTLAGDRSSYNCQNFVNSLFGPNVRTIQPDSIEPVDFTGGQLGRIVDIWTRRWFGQDEQHCPWTDAELLKVISRYIATATANGKPLSLWLPKIERRSSANPSVFRLTGYRRHAFLTASGRWNVETVSRFLTLLATGAHFVAISADADLPPRTSVQSFDEAVAAAGLPTSQNLGDSRCYSPVTNLTSRYYLDLDGDFAPPGCGLILAFLVGRTIPGAFPVRGSFNTYFQLEGWPSGTTRHGGDEVLRKATQWAVSTFGACPYSEKRGTTIFLAPPGWTPQVYQTTRMMPYVGAYATNPDEPAPPFWLDTALVEAPADAPALPARYFVQS